MTEHERNFFGYMKVISAWHYLLVAKYRAPESLEVLKDVRRTFRIYDETLVHYAYEEARAKYFIWEE